MMIAFALGLVLLQPPFPMPPVPLDQPPDSPVSEVLTDAEINAIVDQMRAVGFPEDEIVFTINFLQLGGHPAMLAANSAPRSYTVTPAMQTFANEIIAEANINRHSRKILISAADAAAANQSGYYHPLPLVTSWLKSHQPKNTDYLGRVHNGFTPDYQYLLMQNGNHILPWFGVPDINLLSNSYENSVWPSNGEDGVLGVMDSLGMPISVVRGDSMENLLWPGGASGAEYISNSFWDTGYVGLNPYAGLPPGSNPSTTPYSQLGSRFAAANRFDSSGIPFRTWMGMAQDIYPNPARVVYMHDNETPRLAWREADPKGTLFIHQTLAHRDRVATAWKRCHDAMFNGFKGTLIPNVPQGWVQKLNLGGYNAFGTRDWGISTTAHLPPKPCVFDGSVEVANRRNAEN